MNYFRKIHEQKIIEYIKSDDVNKKNKIFEQWLYEPFFIIINSLLYKYKYRYYAIFEEYKPADIISETMCHLVKKMPKFNYEKGNAFSYFSVMAKHYLTNRQYKLLRTTQVDPYELRNENDKSDYIINKDFLMDEIFKNFIEYIDNNIDSISINEIQRKTILIIRDLFKDVNEFNKNFKTKKSIIQYINKKSNNTISIIVITKTIQKIHKLFNKIKNNTISKYSINN